MLMISADTYLNIIPDMNQTLVLFTCIPAGKTSPAVCGVFTYQTSPLLPHLCFPFFSFLFSPQSSPNLWFHFLSNASLILCALSYYVPYLVLAIILNLIMCEA